MNNPRTLPVLSALHNARESFHKYYRPPGTSRDWYKAINLPESLRSRVHDRVPAALWVITLYNLRAGEYLRAAAGDVMDRDRLFICGEKGSRDAIVVLPGLTEQFQDARSVSPGMVVAGLTYRQLWQGCVRIGYGKLIGTHKNVSRTHLSRYQVANDVCLRGERTAGDILRHRSRRSCKYYLSQKE